MLVPNNTHAYINNNQENCQVVKPGGCWSG